MGLRQLKISQKVTNRETRSLSNYLTEVGRLSGPLTPEEETDLVQTIKNGDEKSSKKAMKKLIEANLRFVVSVAKQYTNTMPEASAALGDLINEGNVGLIKAAERFDETRGFKFISYAVWWIRQSIMEYLSQNSRHIRLPANKVQMLNKLKNADIELEQKLQRPPTSQELSDHLGGDFTLKVVEELFFANNYVSSLDAPVSNEDDAAILSDVVPNSNDQYDVNRTLKSEDLRVKLYAALKGIQQREKDVIISYFGISGPAKSLDQIGIEMDLTTERVRQIRESGLRKLGRKSNLSVLKEYL